MTTLAMTRAIERSAGHLYTYREGDKTYGPFPGATAICGLQDSLGGSDGLLTWAVNLALDAVEQNQGTIGDWAVVRQMALQAKNEPRDTGTAIHAAIDAFNKGQPMALTERVAPYVAQYGAAVYQKGIQILGSERFVVNPDVGVGGTLDSLVEIDGERGPLDAKSGREKLSQKIQLALLSMGKYWGEAGLEAEPMPKLSGVGWILLLRPDRYELVRHEITDTDREHAIALVETYRRIREWSATYMPAP